MHKEEKRPAGRVALLGILCALAVALSFLEGLLPVLPVPGAKLGLSNIVVMATLSSMNLPAALAVVFVKAAFALLQAHMSRTGGAPEKKEEAPLPPPQQLSEPPEYTREDIARKLEGDGRFACLLREVEHKLGPLSTPSVKKLLGLYENLGLPADVVYTLVNYCIAKKEQQFGEGRLPNMREIEKEGYVWARKELFSIEKASEYMKREQSLRGRYPEYMAALQMQGRASAPSEEKYLSAWAEMGFPAETVSEAYDRTILHCHEFRWPYCNGILKRWHEKGLHTLAEVKAENAKEQSKPKKNTTGGNAWMKEYLNQ